MNALTFVIRLVEPVLATQPQSGEANSAVSYSFIPGSMIRGALIARYLGGRRTDAGDADLRALFLGNDPCYLNAYLAHPGTGERMLPRPLSWVVPKSEADDHAAPIHDPAAKGGLPDCPKAPRGGDYCWRSIAAAVDKPDDLYERYEEPEPPQIRVELAQPEIRIAVHNASVDRNRKAERVSQVFRYEALAPGQVLVGVILSEDERLLDERIRPLLVEGDLALGGSHTAGYGRVTIESVEQVSDWQEYTPDPAADPGSGRPVLTCLSDLILRPAEGDVIEALGRLAGARPDDGFWRTRLVGGFNRKWGLPLPQDWAIEAGSVFIFPPGSGPQLERLVAGGAGCRRTEGFGRVAVNWFARDVIPQSELQLPDPAVTAPPQLVAAEDVELARRMATRRLEKALERSVLEEINRLAGGKDAFHHLPRAAQLSRARVAARRAWASGDLGAITRFLDGLSDTSKREWERATLLSTSLYSWIRRQAGGDDAFEPVREFPTVAGIRAECDGKLRNRTLARLVEGVLRRAVRVAKDRAEGGDDE